MSAQAAVASGRRIAEAQMTSTLRYFTPGPNTTDPTTGQVTQPEGTPTRCKAKIRPATERDFPAQAGGGQVFGSNYLVAVPFAQTPIPTVGQRLVMESSPDPAVVGLTLQIRHVDFGDALTARRMLCYKVS